MVPPASHRVTRVRWYSGFTPQSLNFVYRTFTFSGVPFQASSTILPLLAECPQPQKQAPGLGSSHFARRYFGNRCFFLFHRLLRCFSSPGSLRNTMYSCYGDGPQRPPGFPIQISMAQGLFAAPHGFSQLTTSFFGSWYQGIHPTLLLA